MLVPLADIKVDDIRFPGQLPSETPMYAHGKTWKRKTADRLRKAHETCPLSALHAIDGEGGLQHDATYDQSIVEALTMPSKKGTGLETEFQQVLSMYDQSYQCLIEDMVKGQSGTGGVSSATIHEEWDRLAKLEGKLVVLLRALSGSAGSTTGINKAVQVELDAKRQHLLTLSDTLVPSAAAAAASGKATVGAAPALAHSPAPVKGDRSFLSTNLGARARSTGLYARMFYTRLIFWAILAVMLMIAIIHAYTSSEASLALNAIAIIVALIALYYGARYLYHGFFY
jgi:hypothetical protein